jgi:hypothetical protein
MNQWALLGLQEILTQRNGSLLVLTNRHQSWEVGTCPLLIATHHAHVRPMHNFVFVQERSVAAQERSQISCHHPAGSLQCRRLVWFFLGYRFGMFSCGSGHCDSDPRAKGCAGFCSRATRACLDLSLPRISSLSQGLQHLEPDF